MLHLIYPSIPASSDLPQIAKVFDAEPVFRFEVVGEDEFAGHEHPHEAPAKET
jgi:hypothetical protein